MCGGRLELVLCSHVGLVYRTEDTPYINPTKPEHTVAYNTGRLINVWLANYMQYYMDIDYSKYLLFTIKRHYLSSTYMKDSASLFEIDIEYTNIINI